MSMLIYEKLYVTGSFSQQVSFQNIYFFQIKIKGLWSRR